MAKNGKVLSIVSGVLLLAAIGMGATMQQGEQQKDKVLRHVVLFKFKEASSAEDIQKVVDAFRQLPAKIPQIARLRIWDE
ncbi:MAG: hypothetical protein KatS3mg111_4350 [Pirellulaceae bacterium]|nr:MAG: hypothetical protein KatS3mg111_4350 [Pirellulaceae bacterium]